MKLLFCPRCHDIRKLNYDERSCDCGKSSGWYKEDGLKAVVTGLGVVIGIDNITFQRAYHAMRHYPDMPKERAMEAGNFRAWVFFKKTAPNITFQKN